jgi:hypothetical protein
MTIYEALSNERTGLLCCSENQRKLLKRKLDGTISGKNGREGFLLLLYASTNRGFLMSKIPDDRGFPDSSRSRLMKT